MTGYKQLSQPTRAQTQQGLASIEFALIATVMLLLLLGMLVFWRAYQAHQSLTRASGDGARMAHSMIAAGSHYPCGVPNAANNQLAIWAAIQNLVHNSLKHSQMPGEVESHLHFAPPEWSCAGGTLLFKISYTLPPLLGTSGLVPEPTVLTEQSMVHFAPLP